jgi:hypothetical protein
VTFVLEADREADVALELSDQRGRTVLQTATRAPGNWHAPALESGDFSLRIGSNRGTCVVTVNRELARATSRAP